MDTGSVSAVKSPVAVAVQKQADGSYWVTVTHFLPGGTFQWGVPLDQAEEAASSLYNSMRDATVKGKRDRMGLIIANGGLPKDKRHK